MAELATVAACVETGDKMIKSFMGVKERFFDPVIADIEKEIQKIDTAIEGLGEDAKNNFKDSYKGFVNAQIKITDNRRILTSLAKDTIQRIDMLKDYFGLLDDEDITDDPEALKETVETAVEDFLNLQRNVLEQLKTAKESYMAAMEQLGEVKANLTSFVDEIERLKKNSEDSDYAENLRKKVYGATAASALLGPIGVAVAYSIAASVVEEKIADWKASMDKLVDACDSTKLTAETLLEKTDEYSDFIDEELNLMEDWRSNVQRTLDQEKKMNSIGRAIDQDKPGLKKLAKKHKEAVMTTLTGLYEVCHEYIDHKFQDEK